MADSKLTELAEETAPVGTDLLYLVDDPGGVPASRKVQLANATKGLSTFTDAAQGLVPASGGGTVNFLRADGAFAAPGGGGGGISVPIIGAGAQGPLGLSGWTGGGKQIGSTVNNSDSACVGMLHEYRSHRDIVGLILNVQQAADTLGNIILALYDSGGTDGGPGALVQDGGVVSILTTGTKTASFTPIRPAAGMYWVLMFTEVGGSTIPKLSAPNAMSFQVASIIPSSNNGVINSHLYGVVAYPGSAPDPAPALTGNSLLAATGAAYYLCLDLA